MYYAAIRCLCAGFGTPVGFVDDMIRKNRRETQRKAASGE